MLHLTSGMTLEAWVDPSTVNSNWRDVIYKGNDNYYLEATSSSGPPAGGAIMAGSYREGYETAKPAANPWRFLTLSYDGSAVRLYVNGTQVASTAATGSIATSTNPLSLGSDSFDAHSPKAVAGVAYPLKLSSNRRYLVDQNNRPFMIVGDSPQSMIGPTAPTGLPPGSATRAP